MPEIAAQHKAVVEWVDGGHRVDLFLSLHNTEKAEYLEAPGGFHPLGSAFVQPLSDGDHLQSDRPAARDRRRPGRRAA